MGESKSSKNWLGRTFHLSFEIQASYITSLASNLVDEDFEMHELNDIWRS